MKTLTENGTIYDNAGYRQESGVTIIASDESVIVGRTEYPSEDITIDENKITSVNGWSVEW